MNDKLIFLSTRRCAKVVFVADVVHGVSSETVGMAGEAFTSGLAIAAGAVLSGLLAPYLGGIVAPLTNWVGSVFPQAAYAVPALVNLVVAAGIAYFVKIKTVRMVAMGMAIYSMLQIIAPLIGMASAAAAGIVNGIRQG